MREPVVKVSIFLTGGSLQMAPLQVSGTPAESTLNKRAGPHGLQRVVPYGPSMRRVTFLISPILKAEVTRHPVCEVGHDSAKSDWTDLACDESQS